MKVEKEVFSLNLNTDINTLDAERYKEFDKLFNKQFGSIYTGFSQVKEFKPIDRIKLDCFSLNKMLGGGIPVGRVIEIFGQSSSGKSSLANYIVANYQKQNKLCLWLDCEHALDPIYMSYCGVDLGKLCKLTPETAEQTLEAVRTGLGAKDSEGNSVIGLIVLDSVASLVPSDEYQKEVGGGMIASLARLLSQQLKQVAVLAGLNNVSVILLNQERSTNLTGYGKKSDSAGGNALKYYTSIRLDLNKTGWIEDDKKQKIGQFVKIEAIKNKTATPFQTTILNFMFPYKYNNTTVAGIDIIRDIVNVALDNNIIKRTGAWYQPPGFDKKINGLDNIYNIYYQDKQEYNKLQQLVEEFYSNDSQENKT